MNKNQELVDKVKEELKKMHKSFNSVVGHGVGFSQRAAIRRAYGQLWLNMAGITRGMVVSVNLVVTGIIIKRASVVVMVEF